MGSPSPRPCSHSLVVLAVLLIPLLSVSAGNFYRDVEVTWGDGRGKILGDGDLLTLSLDKSSGSGFQSKQDYLFAKVDMQLKLVPGNSAGTVTTYYLSSQGDKHDEIDMEFLGNETGQPYTLHTNVFTQGKGDREQQFRLWFDPTADFHTYSIIWNPQRIRFVVDGTPIREFKNMEEMGVGFPESQPMKLYSSLWNADDWATQGGRVKADWSNAPFTASYRGLSISACTTGAAAASNQEQELDSTSQHRMRWVHHNYMIYDYCADAPRFPQGLPKECTLSA